MNWEIILIFIGAFGIGTGTWGIIDKIIQYNFDKKKFLFKEKLEAFDSLAKNIIGFSLYKKLPTNVFEDYAESARARLFISDKELDRNIKQFFTDLDLLKNPLKNDDKLILDKKWKKLQEEAVDILDALKKDLNNTL